MSIPPIIHQFWLEPIKDPIPYEFLGWRESLRELNPEWDLRLYLGEDWKRLEGFKTSPLFPLFQSAKTQAGKTDILRLYTVWKYGGIYLDMDYEPRQRFPKDWLHSPKAKVVLAKDKPSKKYRHGVVTNSVFAAPAKHPLLELLMEEIVLRFDPEAQPNKVTGPGLWTASILNDVRKSGSLIRIKDTYDLLPPELFNKQSGLIARHHQAGSWVRPVYVICERDRDLCEALQEGGFSFSGDPEFKCAEFEKLWDIDPGKLPHEFRAAAFKFLTKHADKEVFAVRCDDHKSLMPFLQLSDRIRFLGVLTGGESKDETRYDLSVQSDWKQFGGDKIMLSRGFLRVYPAEALSRIVARTFPEKVSRVFDMQAAIELLKKKFAGKNLPYPRENADFEKNPDF